MRRKKLTPDHGRLTIRLALAATLVAVGTNAAGAASLPIAIADKLTVRVVEWQAAEATFTEIAPLGGTYIVGADGDIAFPFVGTVPAAGSTAADLSSKLGAALEKTLGLTSAPNVSIEIASFAPVYVAGGVQTPGAYDFAPGLNVIKAVSLAGGERHTDQAQSGQDLASLQGTYQLMLSQRIRLRVELARLDAELAQQDHFDIPTDLQGIPGIDQLVAAEKAALDADRRSTDLQISGFKNQIELNNKQIDNLAQKKVTVQQELQIAQGQLADVQKLAQNGLAITARVSSLQSDVATFQSQLLDIDASTLQAQQAIANAQNQQEAVQTTFFVTTATTQRDVSGQIADLDVKIATQANMIRQGLTLSPAEEAAVPAVYSYQIMREGKTIDAQATTEVEPGDVVLMNVAVAAPQQPSASGGTQPSANPQPAQPAPSAQSGDTSPPKQ